MESIIQDKMMELVETVVENVDGCRFNTSSELMSYVEDNPRYVLTKYKVLLYSTHVFSVYVDGKLRGVLTYSMDPKTPAIIEYLEEEM